MAYQAVLDARADVDTTVLREALALRKEKQMHKDEDKVRDWEDYFYIEYDTVRLGDRGQIFNVGYKLSRVVAGKWEEDAYTSHSFTITHWVIKDRPDVKKPVEHNLVKADKLTEAVLEAERRVAEGKANFRYVIGEIAEQFRKLTGETFSG